jgi:hypothetical protein
MPRSERTHKDGESRSGVDSFHLGEFPWGVTADDAPDELTLTFEDSVLDESTGSRVARRCIISATKRWGLPNWFDTDIVLALMKITQEKTGWRSRILPFSLHQIARELRLNLDSGFVRKRLQEGILRLKATTYEFQNGWRKDNGEWRSTEAFCLIDNARLTNTKEFYDSDEEQHLKWNDVVVESMLQENRRFDWDFYLELGKPTDKRLYRFLDKRWAYMSGVTYAVPDLCTNKLGLKAGQEAFKYKQTLLKVIERLQQRGFPVKADFEGRGKDLRVVLKKTPHRVLRAANLETAPPKAKPSGIVLELKNRGVNNGEELAKNFSEEKILRAMENFDDRNQHGEEKSAGWLRKAIESRVEYGFRKGYRSKAEREAERAKAEQQRRDDAVHAARERAQLARERAEEQARRESVEVYLKKLTEDEKRDLEIRVRDSVGHVGRIGWTLATMRMLYIYEYLTKEGILPSDASMSVEKSADRKCDPTCLAVQKSTPFQAAHRDD